MAPTRQLLAIGALTALASANLEMIGKRAIDGNFIYGVQRFAKDEGLAALAPPSQFGAMKNASKLKDRSAELYNFHKRQYCDPGYGYCASMFALTFLGSSTPPEPFRVNYHKNLPNLLQLMLT